MGSGFIRFNAAFHVLGMLVQQNLKEKGSSVLFARWPCGDNTVAMFQQPSYGCVNVAMELLILEMLDHSHCPQKRTLEEWPTNARAVYQNSTDFSTAGLSVHT